MRRTVSGPFAIIDAVLIIAVGARSLPFRVKKKGATAKAAADQWRAASLDVDRMPVLLINNR